jgi:hypothetical protein
LIVGLKLYCVIKQEKHKRNESFFNIIAWLRREIFFVQKATVGDTWLWGIRFRSREDKVIA